MITERLGEGGMGAVFAAEHQQLKKPGAKPARAIPKQSVELRNNGVRHPARAADYRRRSNTKRSATRHRASRTQSGCCDRTHVDTKAQTQQREWALGVILVLTILGLGAWLGTTADPLWDEATAPKASPATTAPRGTGNAKDEHVTPPAP